MLLKGKTAIITGATGGIGRVIAQTLAKEGCRLVLVGRKKAILEMLRRELKQYGCQFLTAVVDVTEGKQIQKLIKKTLKKFSQIDILVNAAAIYGPIGPFVINNMNKWREAININLIGTVLCCRAVLPFMIKRKAGKIINFSGGGAVSPRPNFSSYAVSKAAIVRFTETLAEELKPYNIQVNAIAPGAINTRLLDEAIKAGPRLVGKAAYLQFLKQKKEGGDSPQLAADLVLFLASEKSYNLTGKLISAKWDNWREWNKKEIDRLMKTSEYTLRRIDNKYFFEK